MHRFYEKLDSGEIQVYLDVDGNTFIKIGYESETRHAIFQEVIIDKYGRVTLGERQYKGFKCLVYKGQDSFPMSLVGKVSHWRELRSQARLEKN